jgi:hypothetical protein
VRDALIDSSERGRLGDPYSSVEWPVARTVDAAAADLSVVRPGSGAADKLYVRDPAVGRCALIRNDGLTLIFTWDAHTIPSLGVWIDTRGEGAARVALEPCLGYPDLMAAAGKWGRHAVLPAFGELSWEFGLTVTATTP